ncbi:urea amidolyase associated protein UAAP1 [Paenibacillus sp.]|uniref:urea amidolyase associated protein UAAP1 n=1 Tax=Paenibacillus sp. TaxID=58172 RepID=UPI002D430912|nr:urea amidolyase associated protein UAAP1 [Paenibacillus sp.]HZG85606.1 urea amidolyase associated protein UAAP1 [Paenibacillus sp.]
MNDIIWSKTIPPGGKWSGTVGKNKLVRFTTAEAGANVAALLYHADDLTERYNMPDTLKAQYTAHLTAGNVLMSDNGRALASIVEDSLGWHDPLGGITTKDLTERKYGKTTYQELRNGWLKNARDNFAAELTRNGLGLRDLVPVVNLFSKVVCEEGGALRFVPGHCPAGATVTLRTELDTLFVVSNTPHPLDPSETYPSVPVTIEVLPAEPVDPATDRCVNHRGENRRAFENTWEYLALRGNAR